MVTIDLNPQDALAAIRIKRRRMFTGKSGLLVWSGTVIGLFIGVLNAFAGPSYGIPPEFGYWILGFYAAVWSLLAVNDFLFMPWFAKRLFRKAGQDKRRFTMEWDEQGITLEGSRGRTLTPWTDFSEWYQNKTVFMLFRKNGLYTAFPKRAFDQASQTDFRRLLETKIRHEGKLEWADQRWLVH